MRKLHVIADLFAKTPLISLVRSIRPILIPEIPVLAYHRIMDVDRNYPFDPGLVSATKEAFYQQMEYVKNYYNPISMDSFVKHIENGTRPPRKSILITFDDGFDDNYYVAYPILKELDIPATIFVATDFINSDETIWYERLAYFFFSIDPCIIDLTELGATIKVADSIDQRRDCYCQLVEMLKLVEDTVRRKILTKMYDEYGDPYKVITEENKNLSKSMTWDQLNEITRNNIEIGSHTVNHPVLSTLSTDQLKYELVESKNKLEHKLKNKITSIAYPVGQSESFTKEVLEGTVTAGYRVAFSYIDGVSKYKKFDSYRINRLHVDLNGTHSLFKSKICLPEIFCE